MCACLQLRACFAAVSLGLKDFFTRAYVQPVTVASVVMVLACGVVSLGGLDGLLARLGLTALGLAALAGSCYAFISTPAERRQFINLIRGGCRILASVWRGRSKAQQH